MPGRPPRNAVTTAMENEAYSPTAGSTPAMIEKAIASGIKASATTSPASRSFGIFENHSLEKSLKIILLLLRQPCCVSSGLTGRR